MNQEKIGKFIAQLRKEKGMTQIELANKLNVTDRAISKWENGRGIPDVSLIKPLCEELGITMNELLSGEKLNDEENQMKFEENILNTIDYTDQKMGRIKTTFKIVLILLLMILLSLATLFCVDVYKMSKGKPVVFSTWGYLYMPDVDLSFEKISLAVEEYLITRDEQYRENIKCLVALKTFDIKKKKKEDIYSVYTWALEECFYSEDEKSEEYSSSSMPYKFVVEKKGDEYIVSEEYTPRDGSLYAKDMKELFPGAIVKKFDDIYRDGTQEKLQLEIDRQVKLYFHN